MKDKQKQPDEEDELSLSQAILASLDSIYQAQIHGARSFLNMLLQIGYPHLSVDEKGEPLKDEDPSKLKPYEMEFKFSQSVDTGNQQNYNVKIPAIALVPINSLAIEDAELKFGLKVTKIEKFQQIQSSESNAIASETGFNDNKRAWNLVSEPKSFKGTISRSPSEQDKSTESVIDIRIKLSRTPIPSGLDKLLTTLSNPIIEKIN